MATSAMAFGACAGGGVGVPGGPIVENGAALGDDAAMSSPPAAYEPQVSSDPALAPVPQVALMAGSEPELVGISAYSLARNRTERYIVYHIVARCEGTKPREQWTVYRRYNDFSRLANEARVDEPTRPTAG